MGPVGSEATGRGEAQWPGGQRISDLGRGPWGQSSHIGGLREGAGSLWVSGVIMSPTPTEKSVRCAHKDQLNSGLGCPGATSKGHKSFPGWSQWLETQRQKSTCLDPRKPSVPIFPASGSQMPPEDFVFLGHGAGGPRLTYATIWCNWPVMPVWLHNHVLHSQAPGRDVQGEKCSCRRALLNHTPVLPACVAQRG